MARKSAKKRTLEAAVARIQARFGPRSLTRGQPPAILEPPSSGRAAIPHIPTGFPDLDKILRIGGLPKGKICEIVGAPSSGKTTLTLKFLAQAQTHAPVAYMDQARYFDADYAHRCGIDLSQLIIGRPYDLTESLAATEALIQSQSLAAVVIDAMDYLWLDTETSRQLGAFLSRLSAPRARSGLVLLFVHDDDRGARSTPLAHHAALRLHIRHERWLQQHGDVRGYEARVQVLKNRLGPSGGSATITIKFNGTVKGDGL
jgi:recombination protein RecA